MTGEPIIIQMTIAHYGAMLNLDLDDNRRSMVERLLAEAEEHLVLATSRKRAIAQGTGARLRLGYSSISKISDKLI
jgi:hypothetical protein